MNDTPFPYAFFEGKIRPIEDAKISIMTNALQYGTAVFAGIRGYRTEEERTVNIFRIEDHYTRFLNSLKILNTSIPYDKKQLVDRTLMLARKNNPKTDMYIRPLAYAADLGISPDMQKIRFDFLIYMIPLGEYLPIHSGLKLITSSWQRIANPMIPARAKISGGYINSALAKGEAGRNGCNDALMINSQGRIMEASAANFFMVRDNVLITPPKYADVLEGITRRTILELARDMNIQTEEREIDRSEAFIADEAFLSGTGVQVAWIAQIDNRTIGNGKIGTLTEKVQKRFFNVVRGKEKKYTHWLTPIKEQGTVLK